MYYFPHPNYLIKFSTFLRIIDALYHDRFVKTALREIETEYKKAVK